MRRLLLLSVLITLLTACGQIGPLYLPEKEASPQPPVVESVELEPATQDEAGTPAAAEAK